MSKAREAAEAIAEWRKARRREFSCFCVAKCSPFGEQKKTREVSMIVNKLSERRTPILYKEKSMRLKSILFTMIFSLTSFALIAKPNPKAASYKTHEVSTLRQSSGTAGSTNASDKSVPVVYFIRDISPESLVKVYQATGYKTSGKTGVKVSTGESENSNYLRPVLIKNVALLLEFLLCKNSHNTVLRVCRKANSVSNRRLRLTLLMAAPVATTLIT